MAEEIKVEITRRETIKPSSPTPQHLRSVEFSLMDQLAPDFYGPTILFYRFSTCTDSDQRPPFEIASERVQRLRKTLSKTLALFYPLAGRVRNNLFVECNDDGGEFVEARVPCSITELLQKPDLEMLKKFLPVETESTKSATGGCLLFVQATIFDCGGIAVGLSISHKIFDGYTFGVFINSWAKTALETSDHARDQDEHVIRPDFATASRLFPPLLELSGSEAPAVEFIKDKCVTRRYVFDAKKIEALQSKAASESVKNPTRVEAVSGLIWKCAMEASRSNSGGFLRQSVWCQNMNMRPRIVPPLAENVAGNLVGYFAAKIGEYESDNTDMKELVNKFRKGIKEAVENYGKRVDIEEVKRTLDEYGKLIKNAEIDNYNCTSWCKFPFYELDLGFGKPIWVSIASVAYKNCVLLMDTREGDGIEVWLVLREVDMVLVEGNKELLAFASLNPSVI
ncbi:hypothetical protein TIFTF001_032986 [Ficus carica]|uniref:BAHD acyltransferase n=1 Tax=Ficus carica TaxID=3494 RepID=A0AA88DYC5_FICCA|nr:hypothetical protein TIFTF001_032986 [Ficus carica]